MHFHVVAAALLALGPTLGMSCAIYGFCHCTNADRSINDAATKASCGHFAGSMQTVGNIRECIAGVANAGIGGISGLFINNCLFRKECNKNGAAGDSNCWGKA